MLFYWHASFAIMVVNPQGWTVGFWSWMTFELGILGGTTLFLFIGLCSWIVETFFCKKEEPQQQATPTESSVPADTSKKQSRLARLFDPFKFSEHTECVICLMDFEKDEMVTALPCDFRHYFHTECILNWSKKNTSCPLCKKSFSMAAITEFNNKLTLQID